MAENIWQGRKSWKAYWKGFMFSALILLSFLGTVLASSSTPNAKGMIADFLLFPCIALFILCLGIIDRLKTYYAISQDRIIARTGIISRHIFEIDPKDIRDIRLKQGIIQRIFNIGDLEISTAGRSGAEIILKDIDNPSNIKEIIWQLRNK